MAELFRLVNHYNSSDGYMGDSGDLSKSVLQQQQVANKASNNISGLHVGAETTDIVIEQTVYGILDQHQMRYEAPVNAHIEHVSRDIMIYVLHRYTNIGKLGVFIINCLRFPTSDWMVTDASTRRWVGQTKDPILAASFFFSVQAWILSETQTQPVP